MNKLEKELLETQLVRFHQKHLPLNFEDRSLGINMILILQKYIDLEIQWGWGNSKNVKQIRSFVNTTLMNTFLLMSEIENEVKVNEYKKNKNK